MSSAVFHYPLVAHRDGSLRKTNKSSLMAILEENVTSSARLPESGLSAVYLVDGMALIQMVRSAGCKTFGELALKYQDLVTSMFRQINSSRVDIIFHDYRPLSIKSGERGKRGESLPSRLSPYQTVVLAGGSVSKTTQSNSILLLYKHFTRQRFSSRSTRYLFSHQIR